MEFSISVAPPAAGGAPPKAEVDTGTAWKKKLGPQPAIKQDLLEVTKSLAMAREGTEFMIVPQIESSRISVNGFMW
jgi:hypothetical protein